MFCPTNERSEASECKRVWGSKHGGAGPFPAPGPTRLGHAERVGKGILLIWSAPQTRLVFDDSEFWLQARLVSRVVSQVPIGHFTVHAASV